jgi:hypothetical protein
MASAYQPHQPARRPRASPAERPTYRVVVHRKFADHWAQLVERVGLQQAQQFWDHVASTPGQPAPLASITVLKGSAGSPSGPGWSRRLHYEVSSSARIDYEFNNAYTTTVDGDEHPVVRILTISFTSH